MIRNTFKTRLVFLALTVAIAFGIVGFGFAQRYADKRHDRQINSGACPSGEVCIALKADYAEPDVITVAIGTFVRFNSADGNAHSLSLGKGGEEHEHTGRFTSGEFQADEAWRVEFQEPGTYNFHDHFNPKIAISVVAYKPGGVTIE